ncbi:Pentatricopeptide repeat-containing protein [Actinidia chinensis var. chinensis]|uniref:Pentatricopeptide repeat-containing protein n=1 Tax=Actinidia chinensis var. chinensis TaxID=1590841 RepID=A0A2R6PUJ8_ACTCC|nr:Pentatricopeptide repeat-containing protein [Actinidia chinensis var. chinensis]
MEIPFSRYQNLSLDQIQGKCKIFNGKSFSGYCLFDRIKWRSTLSKIRCSLVEQGLKPRPMLKPSRINLDREEETIHSEVPEIKIPCSGLCAQIEKLVVCKRYLEALELFEIIECEGSYDLTKSTYDALVNACIGSKSIRGVKRVFNYMMDSGFEPDHYMRNRVLLMHVKCGMMIDARRLFDEMPKRNLISWSMMIAGVVDLGDYVEAFRLFLTLWEEFSGAGSRVFATMIRAASGLELVFPGRQLHSSALKVGVNDNIFVSCALIDMYSKCGSIDDARCVFEEMPEKTTVAWNTIIAGYAFHGHSEEALDMYYEMQDSGAKMDQFTFSMIISVCARLASLEHAKQAHAGLVRHGYGLDIVGNTALVDFYSKWGRLEDARNVFENMPRKNVVSWNALIAGYGNHGRGIEAVELFERMVSEGMAPNHITFLAVLSACSYSGLSDRGWEIFESMKRDHKVKPRAMHYACMIELLGRQGLLDKAFDLIQDARFQPTVNMWAALLRACRVHKNLELGKFAAEKICGMEPETLSTYVVLLNLYYRSGMVNEAAGIIETLKRKGFRMLPVCTWTQIKKQPHVFLSADKNHIQMKEVYEKLDELMVEIAKHGYVPGVTKSLLPDVDEKEERILLHHSEKLATAFGLLNTSSSDALRLVQSHRICGDCHNAIKLIAMVTRREIIVRDASRFHRFKDGNCSCGDYW